MATIIGPGNPGPGFRRRPPMHGDPQQPPHGGMVGDPQGPPPPHGPPPVGGGQITGDPQNSGGQPQVIQRQANDMYRSALLRRAQGGGMGGGMSTGQGMSEQGPSGGRFGGQHSQGNPLADLLRTKTSRRVMKGMGPGGR